jgi:hypothetical protein
VSAPPLAIDLYCGLGGWAEGFLAEGWRVIGYDIEAHDYGTGGYEGELILQDVTTLHGSQFKDAVVIVASPPCQAYSYRAMPWKRAKSLPPPDNTLFDACFRIQREASKAAGRYIPLIVENVRGAQKWVGPAKWHFGSYYLWGDVPALMPMVHSVKVRGFRFDGSGKSFQTAAVEATKVPGLDNGCFPPGGLAQGVINGRKHDGSGWTEKGSLASHNRLVPNTWENCSLHRKQSSRSNSRKAASALIAKIPFALALHIAQVLKPEARELKGGASSGSV